MQSYSMRKIEDYIGKRYGHLTVIGEAPKTHKYSNSFLFQCDCGNVIAEQPTRVMSGHKSSCGKCEYAGKTGIPTFNPDHYIGRKNNMLTVIGVADKKPTEKRWKLKCLCDCGNYTEIYPDQFNRGAVKSCGCLRRRGTRTVDSRSKHPLYGIWNQMMGRCYRKSDKHYHLYGGRGIKVCEEWHDFWNFAKWSDSIGGRPDNEEIDRIDNDGDYCPENCRWATRKQQNSNKSNNIVIEYNGKKQTLAEWSEETGIRWGVLNHRYHRGWSAERMLTTPVQIHKKHD